MKNESYFFIIGILALIICAELILFLGNFLYGLGLYGFGLLFIILGIAFFTTDLYGTDSILQIFILFILLRLISISIPQIFIDNVTYQWLLTFGIMLIPIYNIYKITDKQTLSKIESVIYLIITILIGVIIATYQIFHPLSSEIKYMSGEFTTIFLAIIIIISLSLPGTKYWNEYISDILDTCSNSLLPLFALIAIAAIKQTIETIL